MTNAAGALCASLLAIACAACSVDRVAAVAERSDWGAGTASHDIVVDGMTRTFLAHVPASAGEGMFDAEATAQQPYALVVVLHGSSGSGEAIRQVSQMDSLADARGFVVAYPDGYDGGFGLYPSDWNAGTCCGVPARENVDDLAFIASVISRIQSKVPINASRIYVAGFSDGGRMAYHVACQLAPRIAAIAVVSGSLVDDQCFPAAGVPVLAIHGTSDDQVAYDEEAATPVQTGKVPDMANDLPSSVQFWVANNSCADGAMAQISEHVSRTSFEQCGGRDVILYSIEDGSHGWPGERGSSGVMSELKASDLIANFFATHVRR